MFSCFCFATLRRSQAIWHPRSCVDSLTMMPNFLHPCMQPAVYCSTATTDGHSAQNLIAEPTTTQHSAGFVAYPVIKPPVDIVFQLGCAIDLHNIEVWTRVGSLCSTSLEISVRLHSAEEFVKIGNAAKIPASRDGVQFVGGAKATTTAATSTQQQDTSAGLLSSIFYPNSRRKHCTIQQIRICVRETLNRCVPALRMVRIFGMPAATLSTAARQRWLDAWAAPNTPTFNFYGSSNQADEANSSSDKATAMQHQQPQPKDDDNSRSSNNLNFPEEFLDAITCEPMQLPMVLPSGKFVDRSTLVKHENTIASWGRPASDPFTGLPFNAQRRPVLHAALKAKIDQYMLQHQDSDEVRKIPRTVGTVTATGQVHSQQPKRKRSRDDSDIDEPGHSRRRCVACSRSHSGDDAILYTLRTCQHVMCRQCLLAASAKHRASTVERQHCKLCDMPFEGSDVIRVYDKQIV